MEQISQFINGAIPDDKQLSDSLEEFDIDEILENELKDILLQVTRVQIMYQAIRNSRRYLKNGA